MCSGGSPPGRTSASPSANVPPVSSETTCQCSSEPANHSPAVVCRSYPVRSGRFHRGSFGGVTGQRTPRRRDVKQRFGAHLPSRRCECRAAPPALVRRRRGGAQLHPGRRAGAPRPAGAERADPAARGARGRAALHANHTQGRADSGRPGAAGTGPGAARRSRLRARGRRPSRDGARRASSAWAFSPRRRSTSRRGSCGHSRSATRRRGVGTQLSRSTTRRAVCTTAGPTSPSSGCRSRRTAWSASRCSRTRAWPCSPPTSTRRRERARGAATCWTSRSRGSTTWIRSRATSGCSPTTATATAPDRRSDHGLRRPVRRGPRRPAIAACPASVVGRLPFADMVARPVRDLAPAQVAVCRRADDDNPAAELFVRTAVELRDAEASAR